MAKLTGEEQQMSLQIQGAGEIPHVQMIYSLLLIYSIIGHIIAYECTVLYIYVYRLCPIIICYIWHHATMAMVTLRIIRVHERRRIHGAAMGSVQWTRSRDSDFR